MPMSKQHYEALAQITNEVAYADHMDLPTITILIAKFAAYFEDDNPRFDKERFFDACFRSRPAATSSIVHSVD